VQRFLDANRQESRTLADIIIDKIREKETDTYSVTESVAVTQTALPPKVIIITIVHMICFVSTCMSMHIILDKVNMYDHHIDIDY
jgi:hypothetical protein